MDDAALATLEPVPPIPPDVRVPVPPGTPLSGEGFSQLVHNGSADRGIPFSTTATNNGTAIDTAATTVREVAALVPELWESPVGTAALAGRLNEHVTALNTISDRWFELAGQARKHADDYSQTVSATPRPQEFQEKIDAFNRAQAAGNTVAASQALQERGVLEQRAQAEAARYAGVTETSTSPKGAGAPQAPGGGGPGGSSGRRTGRRRGRVRTRRAQLAKSAAGEGETAQAGQAGDAAGQLAQLLPAALGAIGGMAGGAAGMVGQVPQALMQSGQGLAQAASQGLSGLTSKNPPAELSKAVGSRTPDELTKAKGGGGAGGGGGGATHPAGALGPPVTPSTSHTPPSVPAGASAPPAPTPAGGSAMGGMPMGMPMGGMMPHGGQGGDGADKVPADKKVVTPPQPHTEPVTGRVSDRTAAAAEASRSRAEADDPDDEPPRGPIMRRITLAPLQDDRP